MTTRPWIRNLFAHTPRTIRKDLVRFRPRLEAMEDRCVPSTWTVTSAFDDISRNSLRSTIQVAKSGDTIQFAPTIDYIRLNSEYGPLILDKNLTIEGRSGHLVPISGVNAERVLAVNSGVNVTLNYLGLTEGNGRDPFNPSSNGKGGAALNFGTLTINSCRLYGNTILSPPTPPTAAAAASTTSEAQS
jgi:hypothetical protein